MQSNKITHPEYNDLNDFIHDLIGEKLEEFDNGLSSYMERIKKDVENATSTSSGLVTTRIKNIQNNIDEIRLELVENIDECHSAIDGLDSKLSALVQKINTYQVEQESYNNKFQENLGKELNELKAEQKNDLKAISNALDLIRQGHKQTQIETVTLLANFQDDCSQNFSTLKQMIESLEVGGRQNHKEMLKQQQILQVKMHQIFIIALLALFFLLAILGLGIFQIIPK